MSADAPAIIVAGNPSDGWIFIGPYPDWDAAAEAATNIDPFTWIVDLTDPGRYA